MTDDQVKQIVYAILGGAFLIAVAISPPHVSTSEILIGLAGIIFIGFVWLLFWFWEWLLPIAIAALVVTGVYFAKPISVWLSKSGVNVAIAPSVATQEHRPAQP